MPSERPISVHDVPVERQCARAMPKGLGLLVFGLLTLAAAVIDLFVVWLGRRVARHRSIRVRVDD